MSDFKIGDKVNHRTFGPGVIRFGPFKGVVQEEAYLMECADGTHRRAAPEAITLEDQELVDAVARAIAESDGEPWDSSYTDQYIYRKNARAVLAVLKERGELAGEKDRPLKVGDRVRILRDGLDGANVAAGDVLKVTRVRSVMFETECPKPNYSGQDYWVFQLSDEGKDWERV